MYRIYMQKYEFDQLGELVVSRISNVLTSLPRYFEVDHSIRTIKKRISHRLSRDLLLNSISIDVLHDSISESISRLVIEEIAKDLYSSFMLCSEFKAIEFDGNVDYSPYLMNSISELNREFAILKFYQSIEFHDLSDHIHQQSYRSTTDLFSKSKSLHIFNRSKINISNIKSYLIYDDCSVGESVVISFEMGIRVVDPATIGIVHNISSEFYPILISTRRNDKIDSILNG